MADVTVILGDEFDSDLRNRVIKTILLAGGKPATSNYAIVGSQEIVDQIFYISGFEITLESETYVGLSIKGPEDIIHKIADTIQ